MPLKPFPFKKIKVNNIIAIGGMIASGKTTLVNDLAQALDANKLFELDDNDQVQNILLKAMYEKQEIAASVFQLYFLLNRYKNYQRIANNNDKYTIVDRTIFEDRLFAYQNMAKDPIVFGFYDQMWFQKANELVYNDGVPKLYVIIDVDFDTFKERLFKRNRNVEVDNYHLNENYFKNLNNIYTDYLIQTCRTFGIDYLVLDAKMDNEDKIKRILNRLDEINSNG